VDWGRHRYQNCYQRKKCGGAFSIHVDKISLGVPSPPQYSVILEKLMLAQQVKKNLFLELTTDSVMYILMLFIL